MIGLLPQCPYLSERTRDFITHHPALTAALAPLNKPGVNDRRLLSILDETKCGACSRRCSTNANFPVRSASDPSPNITAITPIGFRSMERNSGSTTCRAGPKRACLAATPTGEAPFGSVNVLLIRALVNLYVIYGDRFKVECPTGSGRLMTLCEVTQELVHRLASIFLRNDEGHRRSTAERRSSSRIRIGGISSSTMNISTAITGRDWEPATRPDGPA